MSRSSLSILTKFMTLGSAVYATRSYTAIREEEKKIA